MWGNVWGGPAARRSRSFSQSFAKFSRKFVRQGRAKISEMIVCIDAIDSIKKSSKSELSRDFSRERPAKGSCLAMKYGQGENENPVARCHYDVGCPRIDLSRGEALERLLCCESVERIFKIRSRAVRENQKCASYALNPSSEFSKFARGE